MVFLYNGAQRAQDSPRLLVMCCVKGTAITKKDGGDVGLLCAPVLMVKGMVMELSLLLLIY